jgi:glycogen debranching enzyme
VFANNGFIFNDSSLDNFASARLHGAAYMRRQLVIWGDCVKLNYGDKPEDCPALWQRMTTYVRQNAIAFHGLRVDNCHSTPLHVLRHMTAVARSQRPDIILIGELFTGSVEKDVEYVRTCGLNLLIRDALFKSVRVACSSKNIVFLSLPPHASYGSGNDLLSLGGSLVHNSGCAQPSHLSSFGSRNLLVHWGVRQPMLLKAPTCPPCIIFDITHDNESPVPSRGSAYVANLMTLVCAQTCAVGSTRGVEELISHKISVVDERRLYPMPALLSLSNLWPLRKALSKIRAEMNDADYSTCHVAAVGPLIVIRRLRKHDLNQYVFILRSGVGDSDAELPPVRVDGSNCSVKFVFNMSMQHQPSSPAAELQGAWAMVQPSPAVSISFGDEGLPHALGSISLGHSSVHVALDKRHFVEGCVLALHVSLREEGVAAIQNCSFDHVFHVVGDAIQEADEHEIAYALFCCDPEERALSHNARGCYAIDGRVLPYAGIHGFCSAFDCVRNQSRVNMDHNVLQHFQQGLWSIDFTANRLKELSRMSGLTPFYHQLMADLSQSVPSSHWPCAVDSIFCASAHALHHRLLALCGGVSQDCPRRLVCFVVCCSICLFCVLLYIDVIRYALLHCNSPRVCRAPVEKIDTFSLCLIVIS